MRKQIDIFRDLARARGSHIGRESLWMAKHPLPWTRDEISGLSFEARGELMAMRLVELLKATPKCCKADRRHIGRVLDLVVHTYGVDVNAIQARKKAIVTATAKGE